MLSNTAAILPPAIPMSPPDVRPLVGQVTAAAACMICGAVREHQNGGLRTETKSEAANLLAALYELRQVTVGELENFEETAHTYGWQVLRDYYGAAATDAQIEVALGAALELLAKVVRVEAS